MIVSSCQAFMFLYVLIVLSCVSIPNVLYSIAISCAHILTLYYGAHVSGIILIIALYLMCYIVQHHVVGYSVTILHYSVGKLTWRGSVTDVSASVICLFRNILINFV